MSSINEELTVNSSIALDDIITAFKFDSQSKKLRVLDQTLLPKCLVYFTVTNSEAGFDVIKNMLVRGAPCIAAVGCLSIIAELNQDGFLINNDGFTTDVLIDWLENRSLMLINARPTAVNLKKALNRLVEFARAEKFNSKTCLILIEKLTNFCIGALEGGKTLNKYLGDYGADLLIKNSKDVNEGLTVLTHCNTGALATVGYGTALGVIRSLRNKAALKNVYCTETRPYNQGSRLTAFELVQEKIPATLIADSMVAYLMSTHQIDAVLVGADCVAANGDTANKIGTLQIAVIAKHYGVPFYVAAPTQSIDLSIENQNSIRIEQRPAIEMRRIEDVVLAPDEIKVWNPCFDVTPANLITGIITELGTTSTTRIKEFIASKQSQLEGQESYALY